MYDNFTKRIESVLRRLGRDVVVYDRSEDSMDGFNNPVDSYSDSGRSVRCVRSYPNRNTEINTSAGDRHRDRPIFIFPKDEVPDSESRVKYPEDAETVANSSETTMYEMQAPTHYDTHVEMFGEIVVNP